MLFKSFLELLVLEYLELIADAPDGLQTPVFGHTFQLFPKTLHMDVHGAGVAEIVEAPDLVQQLIAGVDPVGRGGQIEQQLHLLGGRIHLFAVDS